MSVPESQLFKELKAWQDRMEGLLLHHHETPPKTYSEMFAEMTGQIKGLAEKQAEMVITQGKMAEQQETTCTQLCALEEKLKPILDAQAGVSTLTKLYRIIPNWLKMVFVSFVSWMLGNRLNF